jgi:hypothetical protein
MNYTIEELENKSDRQIDYLVAEKHLSISTDKDIQHMFQRGMLNYCNSWADMGPIITASKIDLRWNQTNEDLCQAGTLSGRNYSPYSRHANPLRAAAIVYLMIGEEK